MHPIKSVEPHGASAARPEQARAGPALGALASGPKASAGTRRRLLAGSMDAGRTSSLLLANTRCLIGDSEAPASV
jgi:hypothetical protein